MPRRPASVHVVWRPLFGYMGTNDPVLDCFDYDYVIPGFAKKRIGVYARGVVPVSSSPEGSAFDLRCLTVPALWCSGVRSFRFVLRPSERYPAN